MSNKWSVVFGQVSLDQVGRMSGRIVVVKLPVCRRPHFWSFSSHSITKATHNLQIVLLINCLSFWCVFMMYNTTGVKKKLSPLP